jgi:ankyrin repeat protein
LGNSQGATPLHYAAVSSVEMVEVFVKTGISFLVRDHDGDLPLHWACRESSIENVREICSQEPFLATIPNQYGETPLKLAQHYEENEILAYFYHGNPEMTTTDSETTTFLAFTHGKVTSAEENDKSAFSNIWGLSPRVPPQQEC